MINTRITFVPQIKHKYVLPDLFKKKPLILFYLLYPRRKTLPHRDLTRILKIWLYVHKNIMFNTTNISYVTWVSREVKYTPIAFYIPLKYKNLLPHSYILNFSLSLQLLLISGSLTFLVNNLKELFSYVPLFSHTGLTWYIRKFFKQFFTFYIKHLNYMSRQINFDIRIKGKLGVAGNSRRRKFYFKYGLKLNQKKKQSLVLHKKKVFFLIPTFTGVLGVIIKYDQIV